MRKVPLATDSIYHIYNRGVEKRDVFLNPDYYSRFISLLKHYVNYDYPYSLLVRSLKKAKSKKGKQKVLQHLETKKVKPPVEIVSFCLMPNHYHLTLNQLVEGGISNFMHRLGTSYTNYFNIRQERSGVLFEGVFKAVLVESEEQLLHLTRYQHLNPHSLGLTSDELASYSWSSLPVYLGKKKPSFVNPKMVLSAFKNSESYLDFVLAEIDESETFRLQDIAIDDDFGWFAKFKAFEKDQREQLRQRYLEELEAVS